MKITTPAALVSAGFILTSALAAQDTPAEKKADPPKESKPLPRKVEPAPKPSTPGKVPPGATTKVPKVAPGLALEPAKPKMDPAKVKTLTSYGFGYRNGRNFATQTGRYGLGMNDLDREQFLKGLFDALELKDSALDQEEINEALSQLSATIKERESKLAQTNKETGLKFLAENRKREGVITTKTGLQYEILKEGKGEVYKAPPEGQRPNKQFMTIYRGTLIDGTEFDSSKGEPTAMSLNVVPGFREALTSMPVGSKWKLFIPPVLAYKETRRSAKLGPNSTLIFELELTEIKDVPAPSNRRPNLRPAGPRPGAARPGARPPGSVSPPVRIPGGAKSTTPPVRVPSPRAKSRPPTRAVSPPVRIPTNPSSPPKSPPSPKAKEPAPEGDKTPAPKPENKEKSGDQPK